MAEMFKALSDETRVQILASLLLHGELCVCDVEGALGITHSKSSRHLRYLLHAGLVQKRREGVWMHYRIVGKPDAQRRVLFRMVRQMLTDEQSAALKGRLDRWFEKKKQGALCRGS
jgi:DNA-binding transcriptional ArsR family regulator